jgi:hypothetical protein
MARPPTRLIVSFIGKQDLKRLEPQGEDKSPILRLLLAMLDPDSELQKKRYIASQHTRLVLFDDDRAGGDERARFCERLREQLPGLGLAGLVLERRPLKLPDPNHLEALYENVWDVIPTSGPDCADEVVFHLSSGTPPMQFTLMLASQSLRLEGARLFETSVQQDVREVHPPYVLALRKKEERERERERVAYHRPGSLSDEARRGLIDNTVVDDKLVASAYAALYKAATNRKQSQRVLVRGPTGSGKWHACEQFAEWRERAKVIWSDPAQLPELPEGATLLIRWLELWRDQALRDLTRLAAERSDLAIAATFRTDQVAADSLEVLAGEGLRGPVTIELPALGKRSDVAALGEALARQLGIFDGKLKERLQHEFLTDLYPRNLHDLKTLLATADTYSTTKHPQRTAYLQARNLRDARAMLDEACRILMGMDFGPKGHRLDQVLDVIRAAVVRYAQAEGRSQEEIGGLLGFSQQTVSDILKSKLDMHGWRTLSEVMDGAD